MDNLQETEEIKNEWEMLFYDAFMVTSDMPDRVTEDMRVGDIVKHFVKVLWSTKELLMAHYRDGYMPVHCIGLINNIAAFAGEWYDAPLKVEACKVIAKRFLDRIICNDERMFEDELSIGFDNIAMSHDEATDKYFEVSMPVCFYNIKKGDISPVVAMIEELEE